MNADIHYINGAPSEIGHLVRVGHTGHRQLETLHGQGRFRPPQLVVEAGRYESQSDLIDVLWQDGTEIVLDLTTAELSALGRFQGACRSLPWANNERPLGPSDFTGQAGKELAKKIADFAIARKVDVVMAPTHVLTEARDEWVRADLEACENLRVMLDAAGGSGVAIDYPLLVTYRTLRDPVHMRSIAENLQDLPYSNLWVRTAGFGADATPIGVRRYIVALTDLHFLGKPLVADCVGGLASLGALAFGAVSGIAQGVAEKERMDISKWNVKPKAFKGGPGRRIYFPGIDRYLKLQEVRDAIGARGGRRLLACRDRECCPLGLEDMEKNPKAHFYTQRRKQIEDLESVPDIRRATRFLDHHLATADRNARQVAKLKVGPDLKKKLKKSSIRLDNMRGVLEDYEATSGHVGRAMPLEVPAAVKARKQGSLK